MNCAFLSIAVVASRRVAVVGRRRRIPQNSKIQTSRRGSGAIFKFLDFASYFLFLVSFLFSIFIFPKQAQLEGSWRRW